ncbi:MAG: glycosyltransferase family 39 protein, partial [Anaerolineae bacterium]|nr:glycosyltransferase family 39 protein [Anaerolineae bacterium]
VQRLVQVNWLLIAIVVLGLGPRLWGIGFGLPYLYHPDEGRPVTIALRMLHSGDWNPHFFHWSSLLFYLNALVYFLYFLFGYITGRFNAVNDLRLPDIITVAVGKAFLPEEFLLGRGLTAFFGALTIVIVWMIIRQMNMPQWVAGLGATLMAVETVSVRNSQFIRPDAFVVFFQLLAVWFCLKILGDPDWRYYVGAGIAAGLAISFKYNAALIWIAIVVTHWYRYSSQSLFRPGLYVAMLASIVAFVVTSPYVILDFSNFVHQGLLQVTDTYTTGYG